MHIGPAGVVSLFLRWLAFELSHPDDSRRGTISIFNGL